VCREENLDHWKWLPESSNHLNIPARRGSIERARQID
jgi:hypothetical protein